MGRPDLRTTNYFSLLSDDSSPTLHPDEDRPSHRNSATEHRQFIDTDAHQGSGHTHMGEDSEHQQMPWHSSPKSSVTNSSSDAIRGHGSSNVTSPRNAAIFGSPMSPEQLNFDDLSINKGNFRSYGKEVPRYTAPFQRGLRNSEDLPRLEFLSARRDSGPFRRSSPSSARLPGKFQRGSNTWVSQDAQAQQEYMVVRNAMRRQFKNADVAKWKLSDYIAHREATLASQAQKLARQAQAKEDAIRIPPIPLETQQSLNKWGLFGNFEQHGNFGRVLGERTIWCQDWLDGKDEVAPWPSIAELKWEGDDRAKTGVGRFLPIPREEGPPGLSWNQLPGVEQYPMDQVALIPTLEDIYLPVDPHIEEDKEYLWSKDLERAIDAFLET